MDDSAHIHRQQGLTEYLDEHEYNVNRTVYVLGLDRHQSSTSVGDFGSNTIKTPTKGIHRSITAPETCRIKVMSKRFSCLVVIQHLTNTLYVGNYYT